MSAESEGAYAALCERRDKARTILATVEPPVVMLVLDDTLWSALLEAGDCVDWFPFDLLLDAVYRDEPMA